MINDVIGSEIPMGLGMALAQNRSAMQYFSSLSPEQQAAAINQTHGIKSKQEMQAYVQHLSQSRFY